MAALQTRVLLPYPSYRWRRRAQQGEGSGPWSRGQQVVQQDLCKNMRIPTLQVACEQGERQLFKFFS